MRWDMGAKGAEGSVYSLEISYTVYRKIDASWVYIDLQSLVLCSHKQQHLDEV